MYIFIVQTKAHSLDLWLSGCFRDKFGNYRGVLGGEQSALTVRGHDLGHHCRHAPVLLSPAKYVCMRYSKQHHSQMVACPEQKIEDALEQKTVLNLVLLPWEILKLTFVSSELTFAISYQT